MLLAITYLTIVHLITQLNTKIQRHYADKGYIYIVLFNNALKYHYCQLKVNRLNEVMRRQ